MSALTRLIIEGNRCHKYVHFELGKRDDDPRNLRWLIRTVIAYVKWVGILFAPKETFIHFNLALDSRALIRDSPLILASRLVRRRYACSLAWRRATYAGDRSVMAN